MELSDDAKAIVAANIVSAATTIQLMKNQDGHLKSLDSCAKIALECYVKLLKTI